MIIHTENLPDTLLNKTDERARYAKKHLLGKNVEERCALLFLNAHMRPMLCITFDDHDRGMTQLRIETDATIANGYHRGGYVILFKKSYDHTIETKQWETLLPMQVHNILNPLGLDVNDVILIGQKLYLSQAAEESGPFVKKDTKTEET